MNARSKTTPTRISHGHERVKGEERTVDTDILEHSVDSHREVERVEIVD
jgi:hypothetical protein